MRELLRYAIIYILGGIAAICMMKMMESKEDNKDAEAKRGLLWVADTNKKYTEFEPGLVAFLKDTPTHKVLYAIDANEEAESYFGLYLVTDSAGTTSSKLLFMARSVEQLQEAAESLQATSVQGGNLKPSQGRK